MHYETLREKSIYTVFLSFNSEDREAARTLAAYLQDQANLRPWLDEWALIPGEDWLDGLERGLAESQTCAVCIGKNGEGPWQKQEVKAALLKRAKASHFRIIPVLLPDAPQEPLIPSFLSICMWVDFRGKTLRDDDTLWRLECGIRGESPGCERPPTIPEQNALPPKLKDSHKQQAQTAQREIPVQQTTARTETNIAGNVAGPLLSGNFQGTVHVNIKDNRQIR